MKLLFVCVENSCRSQMAEALARMRGADEASAGSRPSGAVHPGASAAMGELGYNLSVHTSKSVDVFSEERFDAVVTLGCGDACPHIPATQHLDWEIPDPKLLDADGFRRVRDMLGEKIRALLRAGEPPGGSR